MVGTKRNICTENKDITLKTDWDLFGKTFLKIRRRDLDMKELTKYELVPLPWSMSAKDGILGKINKDTLSAEIKQLGVSVVDTGSNNARIIDGMAIPQKTVIDNKIFFYIAKSISIV